MMFPADQDRALTQIRLLPRRGFNPREQYATDAQAPPTESDYQGGSKHYEGGRSQRDGYYNSVSLLCGLTAQSNLADSSTINPSELWESREQVKAE